MRDLTAEGHYLNARKLGQKEYAKNVSKGEVGYLPSLEGLVKNTEIVSEIDLGIVEIPLKKVRGTYSHLRSLSFGRNFMPILDDKSEFQGKWIKLCSAHINEGIKHSIKVYEYLNWFYVIEGNKRVSVLKYFGAYSISANVIRLIPKKDSNDTSISLYYEFLKFNKITNIFTIYFSKFGSFDKMLEILELYNPNISSLDTKYKYFEIYIYNPFRELYYKLGGEKLRMTTGDAFLEFLKIYGIPNEIDAKKITPKLKELLTELESMSNNEAINIQTTPEEKQPNSMLSTLTTLVMPKKILKVAFAYARTIEGSGWTYAHEIGRQYIEKVFEGQIETTYVENVPEDGKAYNVFKKLAKQGYDIIFTTSPIFMKSTLKCALDYPQVKFFNCSESQPYVHVGNYFGRTYEPRFLTGIIAGSMTKSNIIGYVATNPAPEVISSINAFSLGAKLVNPYAKVIVSWTNEWNSSIKSNNAGEKLINAGADIISNANLLKEHPISKEYGVYSMLCTINSLTKQPDKYLAAPIWNWGIFYERILRNILNDTFTTITDIFSSNSKIVNFWWGMSSGVLDVFYSTEFIPEETQKLVNLMKKMITENVFHPFSGPIYDQQGALIIDSEENATHEQILSMNWFVENVEAFSPFK
jgi:basic membrane lipoprotein Med (substrate-binding protein (PBP1-ABC) superfamily)